MRWMSKNVEKIVKSLPNLVSQEHFFWSNVKGFFSLLTDFWESEKYFRDNTDKTEKRLTKRKDTAFIMYQNCKA